ncbi:general stress protein [Vallicoccus soli]|uniref:General stress protein 17M-like domain-containing protein n=1 Tax=Vallicoccus soli TaxID=2339232 RepID=A0A3A3Z4Z9_9ACTN|nr:general stress protein [Vallicoccus soli]RJK98053.1 hypothetical protein D5H78_03700 [Vallicoccus soli]
MTGTAARESVARTTSYATAQEAVDLLADRGFPVEAVQIVGTDLRLVEQVYGRLDRGRAALMGAASGAWVGLLVGVLLALFATSGTAAVLLLLWGLLVGAAFGALAGVAAHALSGGRRDFVARSQVVPQHYDVLVEAPHVARARELLAAGR